MEIKDILIINPGSTSTKIAIYNFKTDDIFYKENIVHDDHEINSFPNIASQREYRTEMVLNRLKENEYDLGKLTAVVGRGGMAYELVSGGYKVNKALCDRLASEDIPQHASSLGAPMAYSIAEPLGISSFIYDSPMGVDFGDIAKVTGIAGIERHGAVHVLNSRAQAIEYANVIGKEYKDLKAIVCHMGGGITVNAQKNGKIVDSFSYDDGHMSPERSGGIPLTHFVDLCFDGRYTKDEIKKLISGKGGLFSHLGTKDCRLVEKRVLEGDEKATLLYEAMAYQIAKSIGGLTIPLHGDIDVIILTGGIARSEVLVDNIKKYASHLAKIVVMPGENEMRALADGTVRILLGKENITEYVKQ